MPTPGNNYIRNDSKICGKIKIILTTIEIQIGLLRKQGGELLTRFPDHSESLKLKEISCRFMIK